MARGTDIVAKLVRDNIPAIIRASGRTPVIRQLSDGDYRAALDAKLSEEIAELRAAHDAEAILEEAADVLEVLAAVVALHGKTVDDLFAAAARKREVRGGFEERIWLEDEDPVPGAATPAGTP